MFGVILKGVGMLYPWQSDSGLYVIYFNQPRLLSYSLPSFSTWLPVYHTVSYNLSILWDTSYWFKTSSVHSRGVVHGDLTGVCLNVCERYKMINVSTFSSQISSLTIVVAHVYLTSAYPISYLKSVALHISRQLTVAQSVGRRLKYINVYMTTTLARWIFAVIYPLSVVSPSRYVDNLLGKELHTQGMTIDSVRQSALLLPEYLSSFCKSRQRNQAQ
jgi:hypothetical protein